MGPRSNREGFVEARVGGRFLLREAPAANAPLLAGFHGYGEEAEAELERLAAIAGSQCWRLCAIEALHPFVDPKGGFGSSWMTSRHRERRIEENVRYVDAVLDEVGRGGPLLLHGFSQGTAMAARAALLGKRRPVGLVLVGGGLPGELKGLEALPPLLLARGSRDPLFSRELFDEECLRLQRDGAAVSPLTFHGAHAPAGGYFEAAGAFLLRSLHASSSEPFAFLQSRSSSSGE